MNKFIIILIASFLLVFEAGIRLITPSLFSVQYKRGEEINHPPQLLTPYPHEGVGYSLLPNLNVQFLGKKFSTDKDGFRVSPQQPLGDIKILGIGDSVMMGWGVSNKETYLHLLGENLRKKNLSVKTYNLGVLNFNATQEYFYFLDKGLKLNPDLVILQYVGNDFEKTKPKLGRLPFNSSSYFLNALQYTFLKTTGKLDPEKNTDWRPVTLREESLNGSEFQDSLIWAYIQLFKLCEKENIPILLVLDSRYISWGGTHSELESLASQFNIPVVNLFKEYRNLDESIKIDDAITIQDEHNLTMLIERGKGSDNHPNALWHKKTAEKIQETVEGLLKN